MTADDARPYTEEEIEHLRTFPQVQRDAETGAVKWPVERDRFYANVDVLRVREERDRWLATVDALLTRLAAADREAAAAQKRLGEAVAERDRYLDLSRHTHKAHWITEGDVDRLTDECEECGLDLRDPIHQAPTPGGTGGGGA